MKIKPDDLTDGKIISLMKEHLADMYATSPAESVHALDIEALKSPQITFFSARVDDELAGCIALKQINGKSAEIKSMRTADSFRKSGVASRLLLFLLNFAQEQGYQNIFLETGTQDYFIPARTMYKKYGFVECGPFGNYELDPCSYFMTLRF